MPWGLTPAHLIIILVIVLIVVGPGKLPETGAAIGKALRGFKDAVETGETKPTNPAAPVQPQVPYGQPPQYGAPQYPPQQPPQYGAPPQVPPQGTEPPLGQPPHQG